MNAKQLLGLSALAFAGVVSAQTIPAEEWVGAPMRMTGSLSRAAVAEDLAASRWVAQAPQEFRVGPPDAGPGALSRAEVVADLNLWNRSGLGEIAYRDNFDPANTAYRSQVAMYRRMRSGPEFVAEVQRIKRASVEMTTSAGLATGSGAN